MKIILALLVVAGVWIGLTTAAAALTPERSDPDEAPDLVYDDHFMLRTPPAPVVVDKRPPPVTTSSTTTTAKPAPPRREVPPRPPPAPTPPQAPRVPNTGGVEQWRDEVAAYGDWNVDLMLEIMRCESGGNPNADNRSSTANGLFQILGGPFDPLANIALAHTMWSTRGTQPWNASRSCWG